VGAHSDKRIAQRAADQLSEGDVKGAVRVLSKSDSIAIANEASLKRLIDLHPGAPADKRPPPQPQDSITHLRTTNAAVLTAVLSFPNGSAGGPDGFRPQHLKDLLLGTGGYSTGDVTGRGRVNLGTKPLLNQLTSYINVLLSGVGVPDEVREVIYGGSLTALEKQGGGLRPIAVGFTLRLLTAKICVKHVSERAGNLLAPRQLGFGVQGGVEAAAHAGRRYIKLLQPDHILVKLDF